LTKRLKRHHEQGEQRPQRRPPIVAGDWQPHQPSLVRYTSSEAQPLLTSGVIDLTTHKNNIRQRVDAVAAPADKKMVKCKHWPHCRDADEACPFVHPKDNCKYFPFCTQADKCLYIHPEVSPTPLTLKINCKYGVSCTKPTCNYKHPHRPMGALAGAQGL